MNTTNYKNDMSNGDIACLFKQLDTYLLESGKTNIKEEIEEICCENPRYRFCDYYRTCINCGTMIPKDEIIIRNQHLNPKYQLSTTIGYGAKYKAIHRIHKWTNYDYRENMANRNYKEIREIGNKLKLNDKIINNACWIYKGIYINRNVSSRNKIKRSLYIYCLYASCVDYHTEFDIIATLKDNSLSIENYNKALLKVNNENKLFLNPNMVKQYKKVIDNWDKEITMKDIIIEYNKMCKKSKNMKQRLNNNSILIGSIYNLLETDDKKFYKVFNITPTTIIKFKKILLVKQ